MVRVQPFRALRYDPSRVELARVLSPPHDVLPAAQRAALLRDPHSIVRLILPEEGGEARFERAAQLLSSWTAEGVLVRDGEPAFYRYECTHGPAGARRTMRGVFARVELDATHTAIRPHERTLSRKKGDRLRLRQATQCDVEPIWLLYRDAAAAAEARLGTGALVLEATDPEGTTHRVFRVTDPASVAAVRRWFEGVTTVIADGHHRYQSALEHFAATGRPEDASILALLVRDDDPGLSVEATHRVVRWGRTWLEALAALGSAWKATPLPAPSPAGGSWASAAQALLSALEGPGTAILVGRGERGLDARRLSTAAPPAPDELAVTLVQEGLLRGAWGLDDASGAITYERDAAEALRLVAGGHADLAVLVPPERVGTVLDAAREGRLMPAKATYFVPKPASGLVMAPLD